MAISNKNKDEEYELALHPHLNVISYNPHYVDLISQLKKFLYSYVSLLVPAMIKHRE